MTDYDHKRVRVARITSILKHWEGRRRRSVARMRRVLDDLRALDVVVYPAEDPRALYRQLSNARYALGIRDFRLRLAPDAVRVSWRQVA